MSHDDHDELIFKDEVDESTSEEKSFWKILVADDEKGIHDVTPPSSARFLL